MALGTGNVFSDPVCWYLADTAEIYGCLLGLGQVQGAMLLAGLNTSGSLSEETPVSRLQPEASSGAAQRLASKPLGSSLLAAGQRMYPDLI